MELFKLNQWKKEPPTIYIDWNDTYLDSQLKFTSLVCKLEKHCVKKQLELESLKYFLELDSRIDESVLDDSLSEEEESDSQREEEKSDSLSEEEESDSLSEEEESDSLSEEEESDSLSEEEESDSQSEEEELALQTYQTPYQENRMKEEVEETESIESSDNEELVFPKIKLSAELESLFMWLPSAYMTKLRIEYLFNKDLLSDVTFIVGLEQKRIPAHKFVLSIGSVVFCAMFNGNFDSGKIEIEVPDIEPHAFMMLLKSLYCDQLLTARLMEKKVIEIKLGESTDDEEEDSEPREIKPPSIVEPLYNWQATKPTIKLRLEYLFNNELLSDITFIVGRERKQIPSHKFILSVGSAVFYAMFHGNFASTKNEIELPDIEPQAFITLLKFLYYDEVSIDEDSVMTTLYTAKKYAVPALESHCVDFLKQNLNSENAFVLLMQSRLFDEIPLRDLCLNHIDKNTSDSFRAEGFTEVDINTLVSVLERDTLRIREAHLYHAIIRWAEAECKRNFLTINPENLKSTLAPVLKLIRFPLMSIKEFAAGPAVSGLLTDQDIVSLFLYFTLNPKPKVSYSITPRCYLTGKELIVYRFQQKESRWGYTGVDDRIRFMVDRKIYLVGLGLFGSNHGPMDYDVTISLIHTSTSEVICQNQTVLQSDGTHNTFKTFFKEPVEIIPNSLYTVSAGIKGPDTYYGSKGLRNVSVTTPAGPITFSFSYAPGHNNGTSVDDGQIPELIFFL